jgi:hypothetical protein
MNTDTLQSAAIIVLAVAVMMTNVSIGRRP